MEGPSNSDVGGGGKSVWITQYYTPYWKQTLLKSGLRPLNIDLSLSSDGDNSPVASTNAGCETPLSSCDFEPENEFVGVENTDDGLLWEMDNRSYDELIKKLIEKEEELRVTNLKLQLSEEENIKLQGRLKVALENMVKSDLELVSERKRNQMLGDLVTIYETNETNQNQEVQKLNSEILDLQAKFSLEKDELNFDIASLSKMKIQLTSKLEYCESINKELENKLLKYEAEKSKQEEMHSTQQMVLQDGISSLRELGQRIHDIEDVNRELDMVMIERDEADVKNDKLKVEICSCNNQITNTKTYIRELKASLKEQVIKRTKNIMFFISKLDVVKSSNSDNYIMFEEAKIEDLSSQLQTQTAQEFRTVHMGSIMAKQEQGAGADGAQPEEEAEVDETGMQAQNIEMVMAQSGVSRSKAVKALRTHNGDIVDAMLELINFDL